MRHLLRKFVFMVFLLTENTLGQSRGYAALPATTGTTLTTPKEPATGPLTPTTSIKTTKSITVPKGNVTVSSLKNEANELGRRNISTEEKRKVAEQIINRLSNLTDLDNMDDGQQENGTDQQILMDSVSVLQKNLNISDCLNILAPANNLLDVRNTKSWRKIKEDKVIRDLIIALENYGFQYGETLKNHSNVSSNSQFRNHSNIQLHVKYIKQGGSFAQEERLFKFSKSSFYLSPNALSEGFESSAIVVLVWYKTLHFLLRSSFNRDDDSVYMGINSEIITARVRPEPTVRFFIDPVRIIWNTLELNNSATCVYWKPALNENIWQTDGCIRVKDKSYSNRLICECNHLTAFAAMDISRDIVSKRERQALELISTIGCSVSLLGIFFTILIHALLWRRLLRNVKSKVPSKVLMHLCVAIGMTDILAILAGPAKNYEIFCQTVSILLYFFVLAVFGWMLCEGIVIYLQLVNVYSGLGLGGKHLKSFCIIGWASPAVAVTLLVGLSGPKNFITKRACWFPASGVLFWAFVSTVALILLINTIIFILALQSALSASEVSRIRQATVTQGSTSSTKATAGSRLKKVKVSLKGSAILLPLLGLTWIFGLLVFNRDTIVFKYLFAICNSLQGLMIFVFHVVIDKKVHDAISRIKKGRKSCNITVMATMPAENQLLTSIILPSQNLAAGPQVLQ